MAKEKMRKRDDKSKMKKKGESKKKDVKSKDCGYQRIQLVFNQ